MSTITEAITTSTTTTTTASSTTDMTTTTTNTAMMMATHSFKLPTFPPTQEEIWVTMAFAIHKITNQQRKMLEIRIALTEELRALTAHLWTPTTADPYNKLVSYLRKYGARSDVQKMRAMVAKRPIGDKTPTEHLHSLLLEFGSKSEILPILRRIFEDSLAPHIASLLAAEHIDDIDNYANRACELYILYEQTFETRIAAMEPAKISTTVIKLEHSALLET